VIRDELGMTGTKYGCGLAQCGACSVMVDGEVLRSCVMPVGAMAGRKVTTIEAVTADPVGQRGRRWAGTRCRNAAIASPAR
jgi:isoquinoline 1-oxidoreductase alpha subunit